ncbi:origin recognition complex subunit 4 C-terminus-domain-containing protein [Xylaria bambusicola]|uniref:origin recognition complex subunit 4 C-terminus-domain-containing protein n=1 Tax=Xylaria bambusicola TaxID=326684 RepID=UPI002008333A|nr:origin recognition complex subunit 4 C-terminus-domain-containing protein [Xylaria bambusicola]KAI0508777.1 origin recognition complex subunit 4 C-terminus-domain-containing protein [Xylaria bambusicola]
MAPNQTPGSGRRKRARPEDDLVSSPVPSPSTVATSAKRRRLNDVADSPSSTPKGFSAISSAISGALGRRGRRNGAQGKLVGEHDGTTAESSYNVPASDGDDDEEQIEGVSGKPKKLDYGILPKKSSATENLYDVPDSGDELEIPRAAGKAHEQSNPVTPSKRRFVNGDPKSVSARATTAQRDGKGTAVPLNNKGSMTTPRKRGRPPKVRPSQIELSPFPLAVKARIYGPTGKTDSVNAPESPKLKGILSPKKRKPGRPAKTVVFDEGDEVNSDILQDETTPRPVKFSTIERPSSPIENPISLNGDREKDIQQAEEPEELEEGSGQEEEDEEVCVICSKPDSEPPNEIIFCEVCDSGFHQKCYNVPVIPEGDWICRTCSQEDILHDRQNTTEKKATVTISTAIPAIPNFEQHFQQMRRVLLDRCSSNRRIKLCGQSEAFDKAYQLVEQTVLAGEGNSMMVIGGRGCGKTTMMEEILSNLRNEHAEEFHVIRLNGFIHTDDKLALKEIWRQLGKEMEIEDDLVNKTSNYADTMASLLALLSHPEEITGAEDGVTSKSVVFIIDEFELFATHARQTLLYNLFDIAQARKAPIAVLGLTTRIDVVESLEKRVKSRFSHRYVYLSLPKSLPAYWDICRQGLIVDKEDLGAEGFDTDLQGLYEFHDYWEKKIEALHHTPAFEDHLEYHYYTTKSVSPFLASCIQPLAALSMSSLDLLVPSPTEVVALEPQEPKLQLLAALSDLELALLISAARLDIVAHTDTVNFAMAYDEYSAQMGRQRVQTASSGLLALGAGARVWSRSVAVVAWERLVSLGLLIPAGIGGRSNAAHGGLEGKMWRMDVLLEEIPSAVELPGFLAKWCSQI